MLHLSSKQQFIAQPVNEVYAFIEDFRNFVYLMPAQVVNYKADYNHCNFELSSLGHVSLEMTERVAGSQVKATSTGQSPVRFDLQVNVESHQAMHSKVYIHLDAELSPMIAMLARNALTNFINMMTDKLKEALERPQ